MAISVPAIQHRLFRTECNPMDANSPTCLTTLDIAQLLHTAEAADIAAIEALGSDDRKWLVQAIWIGSYGSPRVLRGGVRAQSGFLANPCYARQHIKTLADWVCVASSSPVAYGIVDP